MRQLGARPPPDRRAHPRSHGRGDHRRVQEPRARREAVCPGAGHRAGDRDDPRAGDAGDQRGVRRGQGAGQERRRALGCSGRRRRRCSGVRPRRARPSGAVVSGGFTYHTVSEVKQGNAIRVTVNVDESLKFHKVVLAYRPQGTSEFLGREMDPVGPGAYSAEIPAHATTGSSVAYYIEAQDDDGQPVADRGTESRPLVIHLDGEARPSERAHASAVTKKSDDDSTTIRGEGGERGREQHPLVRQRAGGERRRLRDRHRRDERQSAGLGLVRQHLAGTPRAGGRLLGGTGPADLGAGAHPDGDGPDGAGRRHWPGLSARRRGAGALCQGVALLRVGDLSPVHLGRAGRRTDSPRRHLRRLSRLRRDPHARPASTPWSPGPRWPRWAADSSTS